MGCPKPRRVSPYTCIQMCGRVGAYLITLIGGVVLMLVTFLLRRVHLLHGASHLVVGFWSFFSGLILVTRCSQPHTQLRPSQFPGLQRLLTWFSFFVIFVLYVTIITFLIVDVRNDGLASIKLSIDSLLQDRHWIMKSQDEPIKFMWMLAYVDAMGIFISFLSLLALGYPEDTEDTNCSVTLNRVSVLSAGWVYESNTPGTSLMEHDMEQNCSPMVSSYREVFRKFRFKQGPRNLSTARLLTQSPTEEENNSQNSLKKVEEESNKESSASEKPEYEEIRNQMETPSECLVSDLSHTHYDLPPDFEVIGSHATTGRSPIEKLSSFKPIETHENSTYAIETTDICKDAIKDQEEMKGQKRHLDVKSSSAIKSPSKIRKVWKLPNIRSRKHDRKRAKTGNTHLKPSEDCGYIISPMNGHYELPQTFPNYSQPLPRSSSWSPTQTQDHPNDLYQKQTPPVIPPRIDSRTHYSPPAGTKHELLRWTESGMWPTPSVDIHDHVAEAPNSILALPEEPEDLQSDIDKTKRYGCLLEVRDSGSGTGSYSVDSDNVRQIHTSREVSFSATECFEDQDQGSDRPQKEHTPSLTNVKTTINSSSQKVHENFVSEEMNSVDGRCSQPPTEQQQNQPQQHPRDPQVPLYSTPNPLRHSVPISFDQELRDRLKQRRSKCHVRSAEEVQRPIELKTNKVSPGGRLYSTAPQLNTPRKPPRQSTKSYTPPEVPSNSPEGPPITETSSTSIGSLTRQVNEAFASILALQSSYTSSSRNSNSTMVLSSGTN